MYEYYAKLRNKFGLTDAKVAQMIGVSPSVFTRWKKGQSSPSGTTRKKICEALGIEPTMYFAENTNLSEQKTKQIDYDELLPSYDYVINVDGQKFTIEKKDYAELKRGIDAYIVAWLLNHQK